VPAPEGCCTDRFTSRKVGPTRQCRLGEERLEDATLMTVVHTGLPSVETRDFFSTQAWVGAFARIEAYLSRAA